MSDFYDIFGDLFICPYDLTTEIGKYKATCELTRLFHTPNFAQYNRLCKAIKDKGYVILRNSRGIHKIVDK